MSSVFSSSVHEMPWLIRSDFTDQLVWEEVVRALGVSRFESGDDEASFVVVDDPAFAGLTPAGLSHG